MCCTLRLLHFWFPIKAQDPENKKVYLEKWKRMVNSTWSTLQWWCSDIFSNYSTSAFWIWDDYSQLISNAHSLNNCSIYHYIIRRIHTAKTMAISRLTFVSSVLQPRLLHFWFPMKAQNPENKKFYLEKWKRMVTSTWSTLQWWCSDIFSHYSTSACWIWDDYSQLISNAHSLNDC